MSRPAEIVVVDDGAALARRAAAIFVAAARRASAARGLFTVALAGGSTPRETYRRLAEEPLRSQVDWSRAHLFFGDERCVPPEDPDSDYRMAYETLIAHVPVPPGNVHRMHGEDEPAAAARAYAAELRSVIPARAAPGSSSPPPAQATDAQPQTHTGADAPPDARAGADASPPGESGSDELLEVPVLDLVFLGLGENGHTASLFPHSPALTERRRLVVPVEVDDRISRRLTMTVPVLNGAREVVFLVEGAGKAAVVHRVLEGPYQPDELPAQLIAPYDGSLTWLLDRAAASLLQRVR